MNRILVLSVLLISIAGTSARGQSSSDVASRLGSPQLIVHNAKIVIMDDGGVNENLGKTVQAMAVRDEIDRTAYPGARSILVNTRVQVEQDRQENLYELLQDGLLKWEQLQELGDVATGKARPRQSPEDITLFKNNHGMGIQFAASARLLYEEAKKKGVGTELPSELFLTKREGVWSP